MDFPVLNSILQSGLPCSHRMVLVVILNHGGCNGKAWPSYSSIAKQTGLTERSVCTIMKSLQDTGWLVRQGNVGRTAVFSVSNPENIAPQQEIFSGSTIPTIMKPFQANHEIASPFHETISGSSGNGFVQTTQEPPNNHKRTSTEKKEKLTQPEFQPSDDPEFVITMTDWFENKRERKEHYTPRGWKAVLTVERRYPIHFLKASVLKSVSKQWKGLFTEQITEAEAAPFLPAPLLVDEEQPQNTLLAKLEANRAKREAEQEPEIPDGLEPPTEGELF